MSLYDSLGNPTENFQILTLPCHSQTVAMVVMALLTEVPEWQWYYDSALESLLFPAISHVHVYIFVQHVFTVFVSSPLSTLRLRLTGPHYMRLLSLLHHLSPLFHLFCSLLPQRQILQPPSFSMFLDAMMIHLVFLSLKTLWRVCSFLRCLLKGV